MITAPSRHWAELGETTSVAGIVFLCWVRRRLGRWPFRLCMWPVVACHWLCNGTARRASLEYLGRLQAHTGALGHAPGALDSLRHFALFAETLLDKLQGMAGQYPLRQVELQHGPLLEQVERQRGGLLLTAHVGCLELCQVLAASVPGLRVTVLVHTAHAQRFNRLLHRLDPQSPVELLQVGEIGPATAVALAERLDAGGFVAIAGDRVPLAGGRRVRADFLGHPAAFPIGGYVLAAALRCPVYTMSCLHHGDGYRVCFERFAERIELPRGSRDAALAGNVQRFARWLEAQVAQSPLDWFNFYPFWDQATDGT